MIARGTSLCAPSKGGQGHPSEACSRLHSFKVVQRERITRHSSLVTAFMNRWEQVEKFVRRRWSWKRASGRLSLKQACAGDEELRREVESLLQFVTVVESVSLKSLPWRWQPR